MDEFYSQGSLRRSPGPDCPLRTEVPVDNQVPARHTVSCDQNSALDHREVFFGVREEFMGPQLCHFNLKTKCRAVQEAEKFIYHYILSSGGGGGRLH